LGNDPRETRERLIAELVETFPVLVDEYVLGSLRGHHTMIITAVPFEYAAAAPIISDVYALLHVEMRNHPERFPVPDRHP
jgi:hypothetical protein